ncbi:hypothetical protein H1C71_037674, partial [Ictidomys tridecemlineatus]
FWWVVPCTVSDKPGQGEALGSAGPLEPPGASPPPEQTLGPAQPPLPPRPHTAAARRDPRCLLPACLSTAHVSIGHSVHLPCGPGFLSSPQCCSCFTLTPSYGAAPTSLT